MFLEAVKNWLTYPFELHVNISPLNILVVIPNFGNRKEMSAKQKKHVNVPAFINQLNERMATEIYTHVLNVTLIKFLTNLEIFIFQSELISV